MTVSDSRQAGVVTEGVSELLFPYLRAWTDEAEIGDPEFDRCATVLELSQFLASKLQQLLARG
jgi:hypothetical protein